MSADADSGPPTYAEATSLQSNVAQHYGASQLGDSDPTQPLIRRPNRRGQEPGERQPRDRDSRPPGRGDKYNTQNVIRFWLGLRFGNPENDCCSGHGNSCCGLAFCLFLCWGVNVIVLTVGKGGGLTFYKQCTDFFVAIVLTLLGALSFILCFLYCVCVHVWDWCGRRRRNREGRDFTVCGALALIQSLFFATVFGGLAAWISEHSEYVLNGCGSSVGADTTLCCCLQDEDSGCRDIDAPFYQLPLWTAGSMAGILFLCGAMNIVGCCIVAICRCMSHH